MPDNETAERNSSQLRVQHSSQRISIVLDELDQAIDKCDAIPIRELDNEDSLVTSVEELQERTKRATGSSK